MDWAAGQHLYRVRKSLSANGGLRETYPQPLITPTQRAYIVSGPHWAELRVNNAEAQALQARIDRAIEDYERVLPLDYRLVSMDPDRRGTEMFAVIFGEDSDVGFPLTLAEASDRAWQDARNRDENVRRPPLAEFPPYAVLKEQQDGAKARAAAASQAIDTVFSQVLAEEPATMFLGGQLSFGFSVGAV